MLLNKKVSISNLLLSQLTNIKSISLLYSLYIFCSSGSSLLQGPHHVAQKCKKTLSPESLNIKLGLFNIDGVDCAKIMFVVGKEHDNYLKNLENTKRLNDMIKDKYPTLTRGVLEKEGAGVNGIYNQDLGSNIMLIEVGGNYNNISEVANTIDLIIPIIGEYINEKG